MINCDRIYYFNCPPRKGLFINPEKVVLAHGSAKESPSPSKLRQSLLPTPSKLVSKNTSLPTPTKSIAPLKSSTLKSSIISTDDKLDAMSMLKTPMLFAKGTAASEKSDDMDYYFKEQPSMIAADVTKRLEETEREYKNLLEMKQKDFDKVSMEKKNLTEKLISYENELVEQKKENIKMKTELLKVQEVQDEVDVKNRQIEYLKAAGKRHEEEINVLKSELAILSKEKMSFDEDKKVLQAKYSQIQKDYSDMIQTHNAAEAELMKQAEAKDANYLKLQKEFAKLQEKLSNNDNSLHLKKQLDSLNEKNEKLADENSSLKGTLESIEEEIKAKERKVVELEQIIKKMNEIDLQIDQSRDLELLDGKLRQTEEENYILKETLKKLQDMHNEKEKELENLFSQNQMIFAEKDEQVQTLTVTNEKLSRKLSVLSEEKSRLDSHLQELMREQDVALQKRLEEYENQLHNSIQAKEIMEAQQQHVKTELEKQITKNLELQKQLRDNEESYAAEIKSIEDQHLSLIKELKSKSADNENAVIKELSSKNDTLLQTVALLKNNISQTEQLLQTERHEHEVKVKSLMRNLHELLKKKENEWHAASVEDGELEQLEKLIQLKESELENAPIDEAVADIFQRYLDQAGRIFQDNKSNYELLQQQNAELNRKVQATLNSFSYLGESLLGKNIPSSSASDIKEITENIVHEVQQKINLMQKQLELSNQKVMDLEKYENLLQENKDNESALKRQLNTLRNSLLDANSKKTFDEEEKTKLIETILTLEKKNKEDSKRVAELEKALQESAFCEMCESKGHSTEACSSLKSEATKKLFCGICYEYGNHDTESCPQALDEVLKLKLI